VKFFIAMVCLLVAGGSAVFVHGSADTADVSTTRRIAVASDAVTDDVAPLLDGYDVAAAVGFVTAIRGQEIAAYVSAVEAAEAEAAWVAELARQAAAARVQAQAAHPAGRAVTPSSGACGGATNGADRFIGRESGGSSNVYNQQGSGAWGCYQIMPGTWASSCSDLGAHGSAGAGAQAACASRLPLSAWSASGPT
jgi:hypothetical protein